MRARGLLLLACCWPGFGGCAQVLGVDDYSKSQERKLDGVRPFDEKPPYLTSERCTRCIDTGCAEQQAACTDDAMCAEWFGAMRLNNFGPIGDYKRRYLSPLGDANRALALADSADPLAHVNELLACLTQRGGFREVSCQDYCELGRDFSCVPELFSWPVTEQGSKDLLVHLVDEEARGAAGWQVRYCGSRTCEGETEGAGTGSQSETDERGFAAFSVEVPDDPPYRYLLGSSSSPGSTFMYVLPSGPLRSGFGIKVPAWSQEAIDAELRALGIELLPSEAVAWVYPTDCMGNPARHVTVDVVTARQGAWASCSASECPRIYPGSSGLAEVGQPDLSLGPRAVVTNLPATTVWLILRDATTQAAVAAQKLEAQPGAVHVLTLYPASASQLDELDQLRLP